MGIDFLSMNKIFMMSFSGSNFTHWFLYFLSIIIFQYPAS